MKKRFLYVLFLIVAGMGTAVAPTHGHANGLTIDELVERLISYHPAIAQKHAEADAAKARIPQAGALDDPMVGVELNNLPASNPSLRSSEMTSVAISARQEIPFPGKKHLDKKMARLEATQMSLEETEELNRQTAILKEKVYVASYARRAVVILTDSIGRLRALEKTLEAGYAGGKRPFDEVVRTKSEISRLESEKISMESMADQLMRHIAAMVRWSDPAPLVLAPIQPDMRHMRQSADELLALAKTHRPMIAMARTDVKRASTAVTRAKQEWLPNFSLGASYMIRQAPNGGLPDRENMMSASLMMSVPIWGARKQSPHVQEMKAKQLASQFQLETTVLESDLDITTVSTELSQLSRQIRIYERSLVPQATAAANASRSSLGSGRDNFSNVIDNELMANDTRLMLAKMTFDYSIKLATLEWLTGWSVDQMTQHP